MAILSFFIVIIAFLIVAYITYLIFKKFGFLVAWILLFVLEIIRGILINKGQHLITMIIISAISTFISVGIEYFVYQKTNSFWGFVGGLLLVCLVMVIGLFLIGVAIGMFSGGSVNEILVR